MIGKIHEPNAMFLRLGVGTAQDENGVEYEMTIEMGSSAPMIKSNKTGKWFSLLWTDIINLAVEAGIND